MRALVQPRFGDPAEVLSVQEVPDPEPDPGQVLVRVLLSPIHNHDLWTVRGSYGFMPFVEFTFSNVDPRINLKRYEFAFQGTQMYGGHSAKVYTPGVPTEVVPEPITMVLLGSGLVGVGGVGLRRRRKDLGTDA